MRSSVALGLLVAFLLVLSACGGGGGSASRPTASTPAATMAAAPSGFPRTITDASGARVTLAAPPRRIISLSPGSTEILFAIGAGDRVVGTDRFSDYPAAAQRTRKLEYSDPDPEAALALSPDLVIMATRQQQQVKQFRDLKLTVVYLPEPESIKGVYDAITLLGTLTQQEREAAALVGSMRARIDAAAAKVAGVRGGPRVFFELSPDLYTVAPETFIGSMLGLLKAKNVAQGAKSPFPQLTAEAVIRADPEVILLADESSAKQSLQTVAARPGWAGVSAVKQGRVYAIDPDLANRPGPRIADAVEQIARALYPEQVAPGGR